MDARADELRAPAALPVIGLTGGIAAGKSSVAALLESLGCLVVNSDALAHKALRDPAVIEQLVTWWGDGVLHDDGAVNRAAVAKIVFASTGERRRLESLVHPWIEARRRSLFANPPAGTTALVIDAPLLLEAGLERECHAVIFVDAGFEVRLHRVRTHRGWTEDDLRKRERTQIPLDEKRARADHVIVNEGDREALQRRVRDVFRDILARVDDDAS